MNADDFFLLESREKVRNILEGSCFKCCEILEPEEVRNLLFLIALEMECKSDLTPIEDKELVLKRKVAFFNCLGEE